MQGLCNNCFCRSYCLIVPSQNSRPSSAIGVFGSHRLIGSIRRESLDHLVVFGETHLRDGLKEDASYYNKGRPHLSLNKDAPDFLGFD